MKQLYKNIVFIMLTVFLFSASASAQNGDFLWSKTTQESASKKEQVFRKTEPRAALFYQLDLESLKSILLSAPNRKTSIETSQTIVNFPTSEDTFEAFRMLEASIMEPALQQKYPNIRTYVGQSIDQPSTHIRISITPQGLHLMKSSVEGSEFIDPYTKYDNTYIVYAKRDLPALNQAWKCGVVDEINADDDPNFDAGFYKNFNDGMMRDFRLALACTIEYASFHWMAAGLTAGDTEAAKKAAVLAAMVVTINRNNLVYENDLSVTMTLVANNEDIIFINADNFSNNNASALINESQTEIDAIIMSANYDIGHTFSTGGGGLAQLNSPCTANKARGITGLTNPVGDPYDIDFVAHELGHQYGAPHTFNGDAGSCTGNGTASNAYEPGSGSTIMAYAGICAPQNVQGNSDDYFHQKSLQMIWDNISAGLSTCAAQTATGNSAPGSIAGNDYTIPALTPYMLTGTSTDNDGTTSHSFTWEQYDLATISGTGLPLETNIDGPLVRSFKGTTNPTRYIPRLEDILSLGGVSTDWEKLASVSRTQAFRLTVRDNDIAGGRTAVDEMIVTVDGTNTVPFAVTSQNALTTWSGGNTETITWEVAGTDLPPVNATTVDILLSIDGGLTYPMTLASAVPNTGAFDIVVPSITAQQCRIMVKGTGNIFFNINADFIGIGYNLVNTEVCTTYNFNVNQTLTTNAVAFESFFFDVPDSGIISDVNVNYDVTTSNLAQIHLAMISPLGTRAYLYVAGACTTGANLQVTYDDEALGPIVCGIDPTVGTATTANLVTPEPLSGMDGEELNGSWRFMAANIGPSNMVFNTIALEICKFEIVPTLAPSRVNQADIMVNALETVNITSTELSVTSPNTATASDIVYTISAVPTKGNLNINIATPLGLNDTFTQADIDAGIISYTETMGVADTDGFRVDVDDSNGGFLPNLLVSIVIMPALSVDEFDLQGFNIYPNPSQGVFSLELNTREHIEVSVFDGLGRRVYNEINKENSLVRTLDLGVIASGLYILNIEINGRHSSKKIIID